MRKLLFVFASLAMVLATKAQEVQPCGHVHQTESFYNQFPEAREQAELVNEALERYTEDFTSSDDAADRDEVYIVPVVFHIIHEGGAENISDEQVESAIEVMNRDFRALNNDLAFVYGDFENIAADIEIEFRLAQRDPNGNCTRGINRVFSDLTNEGGDDMRDLIRWPRDMYLNIWVCKYAGGAAAYTYRPGSVDSPWWADRDGIVSQHSYVGNMGTSNVTRSRTLTHEAGHWLNLMHTWGGSNEPGLAENCDMDDNVNDTPLTIGWTSCDLDGESCGSLDNVENYMEYSYCTKMFTQGQRSRMRAALLSGVADRNQLITTSNLIATGVYQDESILCAVDFDASHKIVCVGEEIEFDDESYHGITSWNWNFGDGTLLSGEDPEQFENPVHVYETPGTYSVSLTASNGIEEVSLQKDNFITVLDSAELEMPFFEGFEAEFPGTTWFVKDEDGDEAWEVTDATSYSGDKCIRLRNLFTTMDGTKDAFQTSTFDMSNYEAVYISYKWSYANKLTETDDRLRAYISVNCGDTWLLKKLHRGFTNLPTANATNANFVPNSPDQWDEHEVVITASSQMTSKFRLQFEFENAGGNNVYIDDINITGLTATDIEEMSQQGVAALQVYPNPARGSVNVAFDLVKHEDVAIRIVDLTGRVVEAPYSSSLAPGNYMETIDLSNISTGIYLLEVATSKGSKLERIVVE